MSRVDLAAGATLADRLETVGDTPLAVISAGRHDNLPSGLAWLAGALARLWG